jgi:beta-N-acetylhexosaminidase
MSRISRGWVLVVVAAIGAFAAGTGISVLLATGDTAKSERKALAPAQAAPIASPTHRSPTAIAARLATPQLIAQLFVVGVRGTQPSPATLRAERRHGWGGVVLTPANWTGARRTRRLTTRLQAAARAAHRLPLLVGAGPGLPGVSIAHGTRASGARRHAATAGRALGRAGVNLALGPIADVGAEGGPLEDEAVANDPRAVTRVVSAALRGYRRSKTIAAVGHFPGQGSAAGNPDFEPAPVGQSLAELRARDLRPFEAVVHTAPVVVASNAIFAAFDGATPAVLLPEAVDGLLRDRLGYRGVVMSDDLLAAGATMHTDVGPTAVEALKAGADLLYVPGAPPAQERAYRAVLSAWQHGELSTARLRASARRVLALKRAYGLLH